MTPPVDVIVDRQDDLATIRAIHRLAADHPTVLAVSIAPDTQTDPGVVWAILRALGKRLDRLDKRSPDWRDAEQWLMAHRIAELIILRAQHLTDAQVDRLARLAERADIAIALLYSGRGNSPAATTTRDELLDGPRRQRRADPLPTPWPTVPRSHPRRLRQDCARQLTREDAHRVDDLLFATFNALDQWLLAHQRPTRRALCAAVRVLRIAHDPNQRYIRDCAITVALQTNGLDPPRTAAPACRPRAVSDSDIDDALTYTSALYAGYTLAQRLTGLPPHLLHLILGDQVTDDTLLGCAVPVRGRAILRALPSYSMPILSCPTPPRPRPSPRRAPSRPKGQPQIAGDASLQVLFRRRTRLVTPAEVPAADRTSEELREDRIPDLARGVWASHVVALDSRYQLPAPPIPARTG
jgi:hypothetical protein